MKGCMIGLCFLMITINCFAQVMFENYLQYDNPDSHFVYNTIDILDVDGDGVEEIYTFYSFSPGSDSIYYLQVNQIINEVIQQSFYFDYCEIFPDYSLSSTYPKVIEYNSSPHLLLLAGKEEGPVNESEIYIEVNLFNLETGDLISTDEKYLGISNFPDDQLDCHVLNVEILHMMNEIKILVGGRMYHSISNWPIDAFVESYYVLQVFSLNNDLITWENEFLNCGEQMQYDYDLESLISTGSSFSEESTFNPDSSLQTFGIFINYISNMINAEVILNLEGTKYICPDSLIHETDNTPYSLNILSQNNENFELGNVFYYYNQISSYVAEGHFLRYSQDFSELLWSSNQTNLADLGRTMSLATSLNYNNNHWVCYFSFSSGNIQMEIRDIINGNIVHNQVLDFEPINIVRDLSGELLFVCEEDDNIIIKKINEINITESNDEVLDINKFTLYNYPNPFNPTTTIEFSIQKNSKVELTIFNIKGQRIKSLALNEFTKGSHSIIWNGDDDFGNSAASGVYLYKLNVNGKIEAVKKCLLLK